MTIQTIAALRAAMPVGVAGGITAQDMQDFIDTVEDLTSQSVLTKTANYGAALSDNRRRIVFNSASSLTFTLPNTLPVGWEYSILQLGVGVVTVSVPGGTLLSRSSHNKTAGQGAQAYMWVYANAGTSPQVAFSGDTAP